MKVFLRKRSKEVTSDWAVGDAQPLYDILKGQGFIKFFVGDKKDYEISHTLSYDKDLLCEGSVGLKGGICHRTVRKR